MLLPVSRLNSILVYTCTHHVVFNNHLLLDTGVASTCIAIVNNPAVNTGAQILESLLSLPLVTGWYLNKYFIV